MKLGIAAWRLGLSGYILPFIFIFSPELLMLGEPLAIIQAAITAAIGVFALSLSLEGFFKYQINIVFRVLLFGAALLMIISGIVTDLIGLGIIVAIVGPQWVKKRRERVVGT